MLTQQLPRLCVIALIALLSACASPPSEDLANADFGPFPAAYQPKIKQYFNVNESTYATVNPNWQWEPPFKAAFKNSGTDTWRYGYGVVVRFNHKRELQGYAPSEKHTFFFHGNDMWPVAGADALRKVE